MQPFAKETGSVGVIENVAPGFELHFELGYAERPSAERLHQAALQIKEPEQPAGVFFDGELAPELAAIAREAISIGAPAFGSGGAFFGPRDGWNSMWSVVTLRTWLFVRAHNFIKS